MITSKDNERIKRTAKLFKSASFRKETGLIVLEGLRLCKEAEIIEELYFSKDFNESELLNKSKESFLVSNEILKKITDTVNPQGVVAVVKRPKLSLNLKPYGRYLAFENISDPSNLGAAVRTAEALNMDGIITSGTDPFSPKAIRASMGGILRLNVFEPENILEFLTMQKQRKIGAVVKGGIDIRDFSFKNDILLIGNEASGLTEKAKSICDELISIKMPGKAESLNAATAAAIFMWEMSK